MTVTAVTPVTRLDDFEYEAGLQRLRNYVEQLERADKDAEKGSLQRAADLAAIYEDKRWIEDLPKPAPPRRPHHFRIVEDSRERFAKEWVKEYVTSPTTGNPLTKDAAKHLLTAEIDVRRNVVARATTLPESIGIKALRPLAKLVKDGRADQLPDVWKRAVKLAEAEGQEAPGQILVRRALADHNKALGIKATVSKRTVESYQHKVESNFDWLVRHNTPDENRALLRRLAERLKAEHQWARGELAS